MSDPESLAAALKAEAHRLGFALIGLTTPDPPPHGAVFLNWLAMGRHASMRYLERDDAVARRLDPRRILPGCQTIVCLALPHPRPDSAPRPASPPAHGRVAAYARGMDYHLVLPPRLHALVAFLEDRVGHPVPHRIYTDTGPLLERDLAQRAGLGWIGKNTCLIHPRLGSYLLLAEILLALELPPDPPFTADRCGTCSRCIQACPTGCILPDRTLDAGRCISYLTIENKEAIPPRLRERLGDWVFGCDVCQMVCPWNHFPAPPSDPAFAPRAEASHPALIADLALTPQEFNRRFKDSPLQRARRRGYLRNLAVALGNAGDPSARAALESALQDPEPLVREHAAWALNKLRQP